MLPDYIALVVLMIMRKLKKNQLDPLGLTVAMSWNFSAELEERWKNWEYPVFSAGTQ